MRKTRVLGLSNDEPIRQDLRVDSAESIQVLPDLLRVRAQMYPTPPVGYQSHRSFVIVGVSKACAVVLREAALSVQVRGSCMSVGCAAGDLEGSSGLCEWDA
jgi:hypothetical protein